MPVVKNLYLLFLAGLLMIGASMGEGKMFALGLWVAGVSAVILAIYAIYLLIFMVTFSQRNDREMRENAEAEKNTGKIIGL